MDIASTVEDQPEQSDNTRDHWRLVLKYARERPGAVGAVLYVYVSLIGVLFNQAYFAEFGIPILEYFEVGDFLLSGLRQPVLLVIPAVMVIAYALYGAATVYLDQVVTRFRERTLPRLQRSQSVSARTGVWAMNLDRRLGALTEPLSRYIPLFFASFALLFSFAVVAIQGKLEAAKVMKRAKATMCVYVDNGLLQQTPLIRLGSAQRVMFFIDQSSESVAIIPRERVRSLRINSEPSESCLVSEPGEGSA